MEGPHFQELKVGSEIMIGYREIEQDWEMVRAGFGEG
jgi:hypothetical protein